MIGEVLGKYKVIDKINEGGMGAVYLAEHLVLGRKAAIKVLLPQFSQDREVIGRFFIEARAAASLRHPGLVDVIDYGHHRTGSAFLVMEYLEGESLAHRLHRDGSLRVDLLAAIGRQIASAVGAAHEQGIIHRDLKPDNVFLTSDPELPFGIRSKILDFGVAKLTRDEGNSMKTQATTILGTPAYMSPEQCRGAGYADHRCDIYSLGCMLFEMACGRPPFQGELIDVMAAQMRDAPPTPSQLKPGLPPAIDELILRALAKNPEERYQTMAELAAHLESATLARPLSSHATQAMSTVVPPAGHTPSVRPGPAPTTISTVPPPAAPTTISTVPPPARTPTPSLVRPAEAPRAWWWYEGLTANDVPAKLAAHGARPLRVVSWTNGGERRFSAVMVQDQVTPSWWWYVGLDAAALNQKIGEHGARPVDLESYPGVDGTRRFGAVMLRPGPEPWWWVHGVDAAGLQQKVVEHGARIADLDAFLPDGDVPRFTAVLVKDGGGEPWWWYADLDMATLVARLNEHGARLTALKSWVDRGTRRFAAVMVKNTGTTWYLQHGLDGAEVGRVTAEKNAYLVDIDVYPEGGALRYSVVMYGY